MHPFYARLALSLHLIGPQNFSPHALESCHCTFRSRIAKKTSVHQICLIPRTYGKREYQDAASDLIAIFSENAAPTSWWAAVLYDTAPTEGNAVLSLDLYFRYSFDVTAPCFCSPCLPLYSSLFRLFSSTGAVFIRVGSF